MAALNLGTLELELGINQQSIAQTIAQGRQVGVDLAKGIEQQVAGVKLKPTIDIQEIERSYAKVAQVVGKIGQTEKALHLKPTVDLSEIHELNRLLDIKVDHVRRTNPKLGLTPTVAFAELDKLDERLKRYEKPFKPTIDMSNYKAALAEIGKDFDNAMAKYAKPIKLQIDTSALNEALNEVQHLRQELDSIKSIGAQKVKVAAEHSARADNLEKAGQNFARLFEASGEKVAAKMVAKIGGVKLEVKHSFATNLFSGLMQGVAMQVGQQVASGMSGKSQQFLADFGGNAEKYVGRKVAKATVVASDMLGYENTRQMRRDIRRVGRFVDDVIDPVSGKRAVERVEKATSKAAVDLFVEQKPARQVFKDFVQDVAPPTQGVQEAGLRLAGAGMRAASPAFRINKDVQIARLVKEVDRLAAQIVISEKELEEINKFNGVAFALGGLQQMNGRGGPEMVAPMLRRSLPGAYVEGVSNRWRDDDGSDPTGFDNLLSKINPKLSYAGIIKKLGLDKGSSIDLVKLLDTATLSGVSPEILAAVARAKALRMAGVEQPMSAVGYSMGAFDASDFVKLAKASGVDNVKGVGLGGPVFGLANRKDKDFTPILGRQDQLYKKFFVPGYQGEETDYSSIYKYLETSGKLGYMLGGSRQGELYKSVGNAHKLSAYVAAPQVMADIGRTLPNTFDPNSPYVNVQRARGRQGQEGVRALDYEADVRAGKPDKKIERMGTAMQSPSYDERERALEQLEKDIKTYQEIYKGVKGQIKEELGALIAALKTGGQAIENMQVDGVLSEEDFKATSDAVRKYFSISEKSLEREQDAFRKQYQQKVAAQNLQQQFVAFDPNKKFAQFTPNAIALQSKAAGVPGADIEQAKAVGAYQQAVDLSKQVQALADIDPTNLPIEEIQSIGDALVKKMDQLAELQTEIQKIEAALNQRAKSLKNIESALADPWGSAPLAEGTVKAYVAGMPTQEPTKKKFQQYNPADFFLGSYVRPQTVDGELVFQKETKAMLAKEKAAEKLKQAKDFVFNPDRELATIDMDKLQDRLDAGGKLLYEVCLGLAKTADGAVVLFKALSNSPIAKAFDELAKASFKAAQIVEGMAFLGTTGGAAFAVKGALRHPLLSPVLGGLAMAGAHFVPGVGEAVGAVNSGAMGLLTGAAEPLANAASSTGIQTAYQIINALTPHMDIPTKVMGVEMGFLVDAMKAIENSSFDKMQSASQMIEAVVNLIQGATAQIGIATGAGLALGNASRKTEDYMLGGGADRPALPGTASPNYSQQNTPMLPYGGGLGGGIGNVRQKLKQAEQIAGARPASADMLMLGVEGELKQIEAAVDAHLQAMVPLDRMKPDAAEARNIKAEVKRLEDKVNRLGSFLEQLTRGAQAGLGYDMEAEVIDVTPTRALKGAGFDRKSLESQAAKQMDALRKSIRSQQQIATSGGFNSASIAVELQSGINQARAEIDAVMALVGKGASKELKTAAKNLRSQATRSEKAIANVDTSSIAANVGDGLNIELQSQLAKLKQSGAQLGQAVAEGAETALEIKSPSRVFIRIGQFVVQGLEKGLEGLEGLGVKEKLEEVTSEAGETIGGLVPTFGKIGELGMKAFGMLPGPIKLVAAALIGFDPLSNIVGWLRDFQGAAAQAALEMEQFRRVLDATAKGGSAKAIPFLQEMSDSLGTNFKAGISSFSQLSAATKGTALEGNATESLQRGLTIASSAYNLNPEAQAGAMNALAQMASKGTVSMEELRQQLGDRIPGAMNIAARSMGVTTAELVAMVSSGQVAANEFLPKFAQQMEVELAGAADRGSTSAQASFNRLDNAIFKTQSAVGDGILPIQKIGADAATAALNTIANNAEMLTNTLTALSIMAGGKVALSLLSMAKSALIANGVMGSLGASNLSPGLMATGNAAGFARASILRMGAAIGVATKALITSPFVMWTVGITALVSGVKALMDVTKNASGDMGKLAEESRRSNKEFNDFMNSIDKRKGKTSDADKPSIIEKMPLFDLIPKIAGIGGESSKESALGLMRQGEKKLQRGELPSIPFGSDIKGLAGFTGALFGGEGFGGALKAGWNARDDKRTLQDIQKEATDIDMNEALFNAGQATSRTLSILGTSGKGVGALSKMKSIDAQLKQNQLEQQNLKTFGDVRDPENRKRLKDLTDQEKALNKEREESAKIVQKYNADNATQIDILKKQLDILDPTSDAYKRVKAELEALESAQGKFNQQIKNSTLLIDVYTRDWDRAIARLKDVKTALDVLGSQQQAMIGNQELSGSINQAGAEYLSNLKNQNVEIEKQRQNLQKIAELQAMQNNPEVQAKLKAYGISENTGAEEINAIAEEEKTAAPDKEILKRASQLKTLKDETEMMTASIVQSQVEAKRKLDDSTRAINEFYRGIAESAQTMALDAKSARSEAMFQNAQSKIRDALSKSTGTFAASLGEMYTDIIGIYQKQAQLAIDKQKFELSQQQALAGFQQQFSEMARANQPMIGGGVAGVGGMVGGTGGAGGVASPLAGVSMQQILAYQPTPGQDFLAHRNRASGPQVHGGVDYDARVGGGEGAGVAAVFGGKVSAYPVGYSAAGDSMAVKVTNVDSLGQEIAASYTHLAPGVVSSGMVAPGQAIGKVGPTDDLSSGAHLDFKVTVNGQKVHPQEFLKVISSGGGSVRTIDGGSVKVGSIGGGQPQGGGASPLMALTSGNRPQMMATPQGGGGLGDISGLSREAQSTLKSPGFVQKLNQVAANLNVPSKDLLTAMLYESAGTLSPSIRGPHVPGQGAATGLIQFMPETARGLGTSSEALAQMSAAQQLDYVQKYFEPHKSGLKDFGSLYTTIHAGNPYANRNQSDGYRTTNEAIRDAQAKYAPLANVALGAGGGMMAPQGQFVGLPGVGGLNPQFALNNEKLGLAQSQFKMAQGEMSAAKNEWFAAQQNANAIELKQKLDQARKANRDKTRSEEDAARTTTEKVEDDELAMLPEGLASTKAKKQRVTRSREIAAKRRERTRAIEDYTDEIQGMEDFIKQVESDSIIPAGEKKQIIDPSKKTLAAMKKSFEALKKSGSAIDKFEKIMTDRDEQMAKIESEKESIATATGDLQRRKEATAQIVGVLRRAGRPMEAREAEFNDKLAEMALEERRKIVEVREEGLMQGLSSEEIDRRVKSIEATARSAKSNEKTIFDDETRKFRFGEFSQIAQSQQQFGGAQVENLKLRNMPKEAIAVEQALQKVALANEYASQKNELLNNKATMSIDTFNELNRVLDATNQIKLDSLERNAGKALESMRLAATQAKYGVENNLMSGVIENTRLRGGRTDELEKQQAIAGANMEYLQAVNQAENSGLSQNEIDGMIEKIKELNGVKLDSIKRQFSELNQIGLQSQQILADNFAEFLTGAKSFGDFLRDSLKSLGSYIAKMASDRLFKEVWGIFKSPAEKEREKKMKEGAYGSTPELMGKASTPMAQLTTGAAKAGNIIVQAAREFAGIIGSLNPSKLGMSGEGAFGSVASIARWLPDDAFAPIDLAQTVGASSELGAGFGSIANMKGRNALDGIVPSVFANGGDFQGYSNVWEGMDSGIGEFSDRSSLDFGNGGVAPELEATSIELGKLQASTSGLSQVFQQAQNSIVPFGGGRGGSMFPPSDFSNLSIPFGLGSTREDLGLGGDSLLGFTGGGGGLGTELVDGAYKAADAIKSGASDAASTFAASGKSAGAGLQGALQGIGGIFNSFEKGDTFGGILGIAQTALGLFGGGGGFLGGLFGGGKSEGGLISENLIEIPNFSLGGMISDAMARERSASNGRPVLLVANDKERILSEEQNKRFEALGLDKILSVPTYARGGRISSVPNYASGGAVVDYSASPASGASYGGSSTSNQFNISVQGGGEYDTDAIQQVIAAEIAAQDAKKIPLMRQLIVSELVNQQRPGGRLF